jgi:hypothetical protein
MTPLLHRRHLKIAHPLPESETRQQQHFDAVEYVNAVLEPSQTVGIFLEECHCICAQALRPLWLLRCLTIFSSPNPFVLFLRCLQHALNNRFNEAASACIGFVKAVEKVKSDSRSHVAGETVICVRGLLLISADAMIAMACRIADDILAAGVSGWWRDRWCQTCASSCLPCKAAASAPILRALHNHRFHLRVSVDSSSAYASGNSAGPQQLLKVYEHWLEALKAPISSDDTTMQEIIVNLTKSAHGHKTAHSILAYLQSNSASVLCPTAKTRTEVDDRRGHVHLHHQLSVVDSEVNAHWNEKVRSPSWGCSAEFRMACVERCRHMLLQVASPANVTLPASSGVLPAHSTALVATRFFFSALKQLVHTPPAGRRCTRTEKGVSRCLSQLSSVFIFILMTLGFHSCGGVF